MSAQFLTSALHGTSMQDIDLPYHFTNLYDSIILFTEAIQAQLPSCVTDTVQKKLSRYLSGAPNREGGRAKRVKKTSLLVETLEVPPTLAPSSDEDLDPFLDQLESQ